MKKKRLKRFILIINNLSCMVIFGVATMSLVSPGFFFCHQGNLKGVESMGVQSETISEGGNALEHRSHATTPGDKDEVDSELEESVLDKVKQGDLTLVSVAQ